MSVTEDVDGNEDTARSNAAILSPRVWFSEVGGLSVVSSLGEAMIGEDSKR